MAVLADMAITERQKRVLIDVYTSFVIENERTANDGQASEQPSQTQARRRK
jgi:hypothetical protein